MYSTIAGTVFAFGIGLLVAHAMEALVSREAQRIAVAECRAARKRARNAGK